MIQHQFPLEYRHNVTWPYYDAHSHEWRVWGRYRTPEERARARADLERKYLFFDYRVPDEPRDPR